MSMGEGVVGAKEGFETCSAVLTFGSWHWCWSLVVAWLTTEELDEHKSERQETRTVQTLLKMGAHKSFKLK